MRIRERERDSECAQMLNAAATTSFDLSVAYKRLFILYQHTVHSLIHSNVLRSCKRAHSHLQ